MKNFYGKLKQKIVGLVNDKSGASAFEFLVGVIIVVVIGGLLITLFSDSIDTIWVKIVNKITSTFNL